MAAKKMQYLDQENVREYRAHCGRCNFLFIASEVGAMVSCPRCGARGLRKRLLADFKPVKVTIIRARKPE